MKRSAAGRRERADRREGRDRRQAVVLVAVERRSGRDRRTTAERRRSDNAAQHLRNALRLLTDVAESDTLDDACLRDLDAAIFRLRFALDRLEGGRPGRGGAGAG